MVPTFTISGEVFVDVNRNGSYEANEPGIDGVVIKLLDADGNPVNDHLGDPITATTTMGGHYLFDGLGAGTYQLHEIQPVRYEDGPEIVGKIGERNQDPDDIVANDTMRLTLQFPEGPWPGNPDEWTWLHATDYLFTELGQQAALTSGDTATIGFWHNKNGQQLIKQGDTGDITLPVWLTENVSNVFGNTFADGVGDNAEEVASFFNEQLFRQVGKKSAGPAKVDAQFMAVALATYFTSSDLGGGRVRRGLRFQRDRDGNWHEASRRGKQWLGF